MRIKTETELCEKFIAAHPRSEHLYFEVEVGGGRCDMLHMENKIVSIYEAKLRLNTTLLRQCINRKPYAHFVYAVVPYASDYFLRQLFKDYGIGVIELRDHTEWDSWKHYKEITLLQQMHSSVYNRHPKPIKLYEENKREIAGAQNAGVTPFSIMVKHIKQYLASPHTSKKVDDVFHQQNYYGNLKQFKTNIYQWIRRGVITGIVIEKGMMRLTN